MCSEWSNLRPIIPSDNTHSRRRNYAHKTLLNVIMKICKSFSVYFHLRRSENVMQAIRNLLKEKFRQLQSLQGRRRAMSCSSSSSPTQRQTTIIFFELQQSTQYVHFRAFFPNLSIKRDVRLVNAVNAPPQSGSNPRMCCCDVSGCPLPVSRVKDFTTTRVTSSFSIQRFPHQSLSSRTCNFRSVHDFLQLLCPILHINLCVKRTSYHRVHLYFIGTHDTTTS